MIFSMSYADIAVLFLLSLFLTEAAEIAFGIIFRLKRQDLLLIFLVNIMTNPFAVFSFYAITYYFSIDVLSMYWNLVKLPIEIAVVLAEAALFCEYSVSIRRPLLFSLGINAFSVFFGLFIQKLSILLI